MADRTEIVEAVRRVAAAQGVGALACDDFGCDDIAKWTSKAPERRSLWEVMKRVASGETEYLTIRAPNGYPVAKCGVNYAEKPTAAVIMQFDTMEELRGLGLGTLLLAEAEGRIRRRGMQTAELGVELDNQRARALYERLGYVFSHEEDTSWDYEDDSGARRRYVTRIAVLQKHL